MNLAQTIINLLSITFCVSTAGSVLLHDTNADKAALTAVANRVRTAENPVKQPGSMPHTHSERGSLHQAIRDLNTAQPRVQPRNQQDKKYVQNKLPRGHHPFDNYTLPVVS